MYILAVFIHNVTFIIRLFEIHMYAMFLCMYIVYNSSCTCIFYACGVQCLCMVVDAAGKKTCTNLEVQLNNLLSVLFQHVSV